LSSRTLLDTMSLSIILLACYMQAALAKYDVFVATLTSLNSTVTGEETEVTGEVSIFVTPEGLLGVGSALGLEGNLAGARRLAGLPDCTATNGCGVHVHDGDDCTDSSTQGGHYKESPTASDPWSNIRYESTSSTGGADFSFSVTTLAKDIAGKAFIVHNNAGDRVACGLLMAQTKGVKSVSVAPLSDNTATGEVTLYTTDTQPTKIIGAGRATGLEANLAGSPPSGVANARGVHVHDGLSCAEGDQGGHYTASNATDPWASISYQSTSAQGGATFTFSVTTTALAIGDKPFILHNNAGGRVACGIIEGPYKVFYAELMPCGASSSVTGEVAVFVTPSGLLGAGAATVLEAYLQPAERRLAGLNVVKCQSTTCGVHVHSGSACDTEANRGGHYYTTGTLINTQGGLHYSNPWETTGYKMTDAAGNASFTFSVNTLATDVEGKPVVVHDSDGKCVACGILGLTQSSASATLTELSGSGVTGKVMLYTTDTKIIGAGEASGFEGNLNDDVNCTATNGCGAHVHSGSDCSSATTQGGHYFKEGATDPWASIGYHGTSPQGHGQFVFSVTTSERTVDGKPFIVHNNAGGRVACGVLKGPKGDGAALPSSGTTDGDTATGGSQTALVSGCSGLPVSGTMAVLFAGMFLISAEL